MSSNHRDINVKTKQYSKQNDIQYKNKMIFNIKK